MNSLVFLVPIALILGAAALGAFFWSMSSDQYDDLDGAGERILFHDDDRPAAGSAPSRLGSLEAKGSVARSAGLRMDRTPGGPLD
ncbi:cytochrome oxidase maturation protein, cbb3-type [Labrys sp. WJW]|uniref:cbb3-type cytochrome oxidase assembly protein CcoS n=1 Tax=Labrys sp. WJW TaxID=1737983 RepID=UPI00083644CD|nr:cytochrome oxidase maturation protein, cbb3-type [Labrys sp. WJW]